MVAPQERTAPRLLRRARTTAGMTQAQVAERAGVGQPLIAAYEAGRRQPSLPMLVKLLRGAGHELELQLRPTRPRPDPATAGRDLLLALDLAEHLPRRPRREPLAFPRLPA